MECSSVLDLGITGGTRHGSGIVDTQDAAGMVTRVGDTAEALIAVTRGATLVESMPGTSFTGAVISTAVVVSTAVMVSMVVVVSMVAAADNL